MENKQEIILGTILSGTISVRAFTAVLKPHFFKGPYRKLADNIWAQVEKYDAIDPGLATEGTVLNQQDVMRMITNSITLRQAALDYFNQFYLENTNKELALLLTKATQELTNGGRYAEVMAQIEAAYKDLTTRANFEDKRSNQTINTIQQIERAMESGTNLVGPSTGFNSWDEYLGGWQPSDLVYLAGRPAMGKTTLSLCLSYETAKKGGKVGFITLEMTPEQLRKKLLAAITGIPYQRINRGQLNARQFDQVFKAGEELAEMDLHIENPTSQFDMVLDTMYAVKESFDTNLFIIDYMQLMYKEGFNNNRNGEIGYMSRRLKESASADRLNACIICLSQLNRANEMSKGKTPGLHNLRDSGSLEQDADAVIFVHRPEYYLPEGTPEREDVKNEVYAIFEKNRHGQTSTIKMKRTEEFTTIYEEADQLEPWNQSEPPELPTISTPNTSDNVPF
jgi:replicative DNA helicase